MDHIGTVDRPPFNQELTSRELNAYVDGKLPAERMRAIEQQAVTDSELAATIEIARMLQQLIK